MAYHLSDKFALNLSYEVEADHFIGQRPFEFVNIGADFQPGFEFWYPTPMTKIQSLPDDLPGATPRHERDGRWRRFLLAHALKTCLNSRPRFTISLLDFKNGGLIGNPRLKETSPCLTCGACCAFFRVDFYWRESGLADVSRSRPCRFGSKSPESIIDV